MTKITPDLVIEAYKIGIFPMANNQDDPRIDFFDPDPRGIIPLENFHISRSLRKLIRKGIFKVTYDAAFPSILEGCSQVSRNRPTTWINHEIKTVYKQLFDMGYCHSIEIWCGERIVGGLYGVSIGAAFFGESMFSRVADASKTALVGLATSLSAEGYRFIDCQVVSEHLTSLGAEAAPRDRFAAELNEAVEFSDKAARWHWAMPAQELL